MTVHELLRTSNVYCYEHSLKPVPEKEELIEESQQRSIQTTKCRIKALDETKHLEKIEDQLLATVLSTNWWIRDLTITLRKMDRLIKS